MNCSSSQKGFAHILVMVVLLTGLAAGVYLVGTKTNFLPKAFLSTPISGPITPSKTPTPTPQICKTGIKTIKYASNCSRGKSTFAEFTCHDGETGKVGDGKKCNTDRALLESVTRICRWRSSCVATPTKPISTLSPTITVKPTTIVLPTSIPTLTPTPTPTRANITTVIIRAWGDIVDGNPLIYLQDGNTYLQGYSISATNKSSAQTFIYTFSNGQSFKGIPTVRFVNDYYGGPGKDRNAYIDYIEVNGVRYETEDPRTYSVGSWSSKVQCGAGYSGTEVLACGGYFRYDQYRIEPTAIVLPTNTPIPQVSAKRVFVTSTTYTGNLGGLSGADAKCQERATTASLGGTWKAWLSSAYTSVEARMTHNAGQYRLLDGAVIANNWTDLTDGSLQRQINVSEYGTTLTSTPIWSNTTISGQVKSVDPRYNCGDAWVSTAYMGQKSFGWAGSGYKNDNFWTEYVPEDCSGRGALYCFEQ